MSLLDADQQARARALQPDVSFCVQAPAGSGKTELLTQRLLKLLGLCEQPEQVLAITFTRKAAGEMRHRLLESLRKARAAEPLANDSSHARLTRDLALAALARDDLQGWHMLDNPQRLRIVTIDSFTGHLTARLPLASGFGARPELDTDTDALFSQAVRATLARLDSHDACADALAQLLPHLHNDLQRAEALLLDLLKRRADWLPHLVELAHSPDAQRPWLERCMQSVLIEQLQRVRSVVLPFQARILSLATFVHPVLAREGNDAFASLQASITLPPTSVAAATDWQALASLFLKTDGEFRRSVTKKQGFPAKTDFKDKAEQARAQAAKDDFKQLVDDMTAAGTLPAWQALQVLPPAHYADASWPVLAALLTLLPVLAAELTVAMKEAGIIDHVETSLAALQALGSDEQPTDLALLLDYKLHHILVDEFQDTSHTQFVLLERLTAGWQPGDGRTLFIVGDGMQSCYGFRNADVSLFLRARDEGIGPVKLESLTLSANFRSSSAVVGWVNTAFAGAFPPQDDLMRGGVCYTASIAAKAALPDSGVFCELQVAADTDDDDDATDSRSVRDHGRLREADAVADRCAQLQRQYPDDVIAILVRNRKHLELVVPALRRRGLQWNATDIDRLLSYQVLDDLNTLLRALLNAADVTALLALLRSPLAGLGLADLEVLAQAARDRKTSLWQLLRDSQTLPLSADAQTRLARVVPVLLKARALRQRLRLRELLELCWLELGGPALVDTTTLPNLVKYLDLVDNHDEGGDITDIHAFADALDTCFGSAASASPRLQIMTIHKAKGLQFDHVLLCGLHRASRSDTAPLLRWQNLSGEHGEDRLLLALKQQRGGDEEPLYDYLAAQQKQRNQYELTRLLYIGVTRAIKTAWLYGSVKADDKAGSYKCASGSLLQSVLPTLQNRPDVLNVGFRPLPPPPEANGDRTMPLTQPLPRLPLHWQSPLATPLLQAPLLQSDSEPDTADNLLARRFGELVHLGLRQLVQHGEAWLDRAPSLGVWRAALAPLCAAAELPQHLQVLQLHLQSCRRSDAGRWLFLTAHREDRCELPLQDYRSGWRRFHVVDRTFVSADGERWIVDYKTATPATGESPADFVASQAARYRQQLATYRDLLAELDPATAGRCRLALYFTGLDQLHELPA